MKLLAFKVTNFRSIVDSGWCPFSPDNVTVLVGQNESGKTSILEALSKTFSQSHVGDDDCRIAAPLPIIQIQLSMDWEVLGPSLESYPDEQTAAVRSFLEARDNKIEITFRWNRVATSGKREFKCNIDIETPELKDVLAPFSEARAKAELAANDAKKALELQTKALAEKAAAKKLAAEKAAAEKAAAIAAGTAVPSESDPGIQNVEAEPEEIIVPSVPVALDSDGLADAIFNLAPSVTLFESASGLLPDRVDVVQDKDGKWTLSGDGAKAAENFLKIADVDLEELVKGDVRVRENLMRRANSKVTNDFVKFWSQTIGKKEKLQLECEMGHYGPEQTGKSGQRHLVFWISDGLNKLYPKQRSQGVRWFVSFYLQLKASERIPKGRVFLLDEPGANLHSKAQSDVLKLINQLGGDITIVYSTHSPHLVEYEKLYRVLAIQRDGEEGDSPTSVIHAHKLGAASQDTLSPLFTAMGVDLSHQQIIQKKCNVILEEMSGFYYLRAFWRLTNSKQEAYFVAATGANNVEPLANMFLGWGLEFIVVLDDDQQGRNVFNRLKRYMFGDDENLVKANAYKIADCRGIEDVFSRSDFRKLILNEAPEYETANSEHVKDAALSKPVLAYQFWIKVSKGEIKLEQFDENTRLAIAKLVAEISSRLQPKKK